jgi:hypothetical protein
MSIIKFGEMLMPKQEQARVNLDLLKKLVSELEKSLETADSISNADVTSHIAELARASGLAGVIMQESGMLVKDIYTLIKMASGGAPISETEVMGELEKLFGGGTPPPKRNTN